MIECHSSASKSPWHDYVIHELKTGLTTSLPFFFFENAKNLGRSDDAKRRKKRGWPKNEEMGVQAAMIHALLARQILNSTLRGVSFRGEQHRNHQHLLIQGILLRI